MSDNKRKPPMWDSRIDADMDAYYGMLHDLIDQGHQGQWVTIYQQKFVGVYPTLDTALRAGYDLAGLEGFVVKEIEPLTEWEKKFWADRAAAEEEYQSWFDVLAEPVDLRVQFEKLRVPWEFPPVTANDLPMVSNGVALHPGIGDYFWECVFLGYQLGKGVTPCR